jgi:hypothetical protein
MCTYVHTYIYVLKILYIYYYTQEIYNLQAASSLLPLYLWVLECVHQLLLLGPMLWIQVESGTEHNYEHNACILQRIKESLKKKANMKWAMCFKLQSPTIWRMGIGSAPEWKLVFWKIIPINSPFTKLFQIRVAYCLPNHYYTYTWELIDKPFVHLASCSWLMKILSEIIQTRSGSVIVL